MMLRRLLATFAAILACAQLAAVPIAQQVTARALPPGWSHTVTPIAPTVSYHIGEAPITTLGGHADFRATVTNSSSLHEFTLTANATCSYAPPCILYGSDFFVPGEKVIEGARVLGLKSGTRDTIGAVYYMSNHGGVPTIIDKVAYTDGALDVTGIGDLRFTAPLSTGTLATYSDTVGVSVYPRILTEPGRYGRKFLRFDNSSELLSGAFLQDTSGLTNIDTNNITVFLVGRIHNYKANTIVGLGTLGNSPPTCCLLRNSGAQNTFSVDGNYIQAGGLIAGRANTNGGPKASNANRLILGSQLQLMGASFASNAASNYYNTGTDSKVTITEFVNEDFWTFASGYTQTRVKGVTGFEIGRNPTALISQQVGLMDVYELDIWAHGELGATTNNDSTTLANAKAIQKAFIANWQIPSITKNVILVSDSRGEVGMTYHGTGLGSILTEPGASYAVPANYRVQTIASGGSMQSLYYQYMSLPDSVFNSGAMLGGGNDIVLSIDGTNSVSIINPRTTTATQSTARGDEVYNCGTGAAGLATIANCDATFNGYIASGTTTLNITDTLVGTVYKQSVLAGSGYTAGQSTSNGSPVTSAPGTASLNSSSPAAYGSAGSPLAMSSQWFNHLRTAQLLINRGLIFIEAMEPAACGGFNNGQIELRFHQLNHMATDLDAQPGGANFGKFFLADLYSSKVAGKLPLGDGSDGANVTSVTWCWDGTHQMYEGRKLMVTGGDTPWNGLRAAVMAH